MLAPQDGGWVVADVTDAASPSLIGRVPAPGRISRVHALGGFAYGVDAVQHRLWVIDVSSPSRPVEAAVVDELDLVYDVQAVGDRAYVAGRGLLVLDVSRPSTPRIVGVVGEDDLPLRALHVRADCVRGPVRRT